MNENLEKIENSIKSFLNGRGQKNMAVLNDYKIYNDWQIDANREIDRRISRFPDLLLKFSMQELAALANGELDMAQLAAEVEKGFGAIS